MTPAAARVIAKALVCLVAGSLGMNHVAASSAKRFVDCTEIDSLMQVDNCTGSPLTRNSQVDWLCNDIYVLTTVIRERDYFLLRFMMYISDAVTSCPCALSLSDTHGHVYPDMSRRCRCRHTHHLSIHMSLHVSVMILGTCKMKDDGPGTRDLHLDPHPERGGGGIKGGHIL